MIPILYEATSKEFESLGMGALKDTINCEVTEERNGMYEVVLVYPTTGNHYESITEGSIIKVKPNETSAPQLFRIYKSSKPSNRMVKFNGEHISYLLGGIPVMPFTVEGTATQALGAIFENAVFANDFTTWSDISTENKIEVTTPSSIRTLLGGSQGGILDVWGGEYEFDNYNIKLHKSRGEKTDVVIEYGKNLKDITQERNIDNVCTAICPFAKYNTSDEVGDETVQVEHVVTLPEKFIETKNAKAYPFTKAMSIDLSEFIDEKELITVEQLREAAVSYLDTHTIDVPDVNITVSMAEMWREAKRGEKLPIETIRLCDTVTVRFAQLGIFATAKVIKTVYNSLTEQYKTIELGNAKSNFIDSMIKQEKEINNIKNTTAKMPDFIKNAIKNQTELITGQKGGHVVFNPPEKPCEILIMDTPDIKTAQNVWRWNAGGLGYSKTGYNGDYELAMTMDGAINANLITAGTLQGVKIIADDIEIRGGKINMTGNAFDQFFTLKSEFRSTEISPSGVCCELNSNGVSNSIRFDGEYLNIDSSSLSLQMTATGAHAYTHGYFERKENSTQWGHGTSNYLEGNWFGTVNSSSDRNKKHSIETLPNKYKEFFNNLQAVRFVYNEQEDEKFNLGFIAQDVAAALDKVGLTLNDFSGYVDVDGIIALNYQQFISLNTMMLQETRKELADAKSELDNMKAEFAEIKKLLK